MHSIVLQRRKAPIVACNTYANVGAFDEEDGRTGPPLLVHASVSPPSLHWTGCEG